MHDEIKHPCVGCSNDFVCDICYNGRDWMKNIITELERRIPELKKDAGSYTGEYAGGQLDLIHEILGLEPYEWGTDFDSLRPTNIKEES